MKENAINKLIDSINNNTKTLKESEVIELIVSEPKYYIGVMPQSTASNFIACYRKGMSKQKTIDNFISKFGYKKIKDAEYGKY